MRSEARLEAHLIVTTALPVETRTINCMLPGHCLWSRGSRGMLVGIRPRALCKSVKVVPEEDAKLRMTNLLFSSMLEGATEEVPLGGPMRLWPMSLMGPWDLWAFGGGSMVTSLHIRGQPVWAHLSHMGA